MSTPAPPPSRRGAQRVGEMRRSCPKTKSLGAAPIEECHAKRNDNYTATTASLALFCANLQKL